MRRVLLTWLIVGAAVLSGCGETDSTFLVRAARSDIVVLGPYVEDDGDYVKIVEERPPVEEVFGASGRFVP